MRNLIFRVVGWGLTASALTACVAQPTPSSSSSQPSSAPSSAAHSSQSATSLPAISSSVMRTSSSVASSSSPQMPASSMATVSSLSSVASSMMSVSSVVRSSEMSSASSAAPTVFVDERTMAPFVLPARIESERYHRAQDNDANNTGPCNALAGPVDYYARQAGSAGDCDIGNTEEGEWLEYRVQANTAGFYDVYLSLATGNAGPREVALAVNGQAVGTVEVPRNGGDNYSELPLRNVLLAKGENRLRVLMVTGGVRFDALNIVRIANADVQVAMGQLAAHTVPGVIQSEDYFRAIDTTANNTGPCDAAGPVDFYNAAPDADGQCDIGNTDSGEWLDYLIRVEAKGNYDFDFSFATGNADIRQAEILLDDQSLGLLTIPRNGATNFSDLTLRNINVSAGEHRLRVFMTTGGVRFDAIAVSETSTNDGAPAVQSFAIINTKNNMPLAGFERIDVNSEVTLNLDAIGHRDLVLKANANGMTKSVNFSLNNREKYVLDNQAPFAIYPDKNSNYQRWTLFPGKHVSTATPYATKDGSGEGGIAGSITLIIQASDLTLVDNSLDFIAGFGQSAALNLTIKNDGNRAGAFTLDNLPNWLTAATLNGSVAPGQTQTIRLTATNCSQNLTREATAILRTASGGNLPVVLRQACNNQTQFDIAFDRFYINQAVPAVDTAQTASEQIPLVKGRKGLARVFVTATENSSRAIRVNFNYKTADGTTGTLMMSSPSMLLTSVNEGQLAQTFNVDVPANLIAPGLQYFIQVDAGNQVAEANEDNNRFPKTGYATLNVKDVPRLNITFVPVIIDGNNPNLNDALLEELLVDTKKLHPIENVDFMIRAQAYTYTGNDNGVKTWGNALSKIAELNKMDNSTRYYHGLTEVNVDSSRTAGIAYLRSKSALSRKFTGTIAHEFGHNFSLNHTDCGGPLRPDNDYPYDNANTHIWGYDIFDKVLTPPTSKDLMSYCRNAWASQYGYNKVLNYRGEQGSSNLKAANPTAEEEVIWLSGDIQATAANPLITLTNVFQGKSHYEQPSGPYTLMAYDTNGILAHITRFAAEDIDHIDAAHFFVAIPKIALSRLEIHWHDNIVWEQDFATATAKQQKLNVPPQVSLADGQLTIQWQAKPLSSLTVRDATTGNVLTNDQTGWVTLDESPNVLTLEYTSLTERQIWHWPSNLQ